MWLLDTDTCIYCINGKESVTRRLESIEVDELYVSIVTASELYFGAYNSKYIEDNINTVERFLSALGGCFFIDRDTAKRFGELKAWLAVHGKSSTDFDLLIASTALIKDCILVTNNERHFQQIPSLSVENWLQI